MQANLKWLSFSVVDGSLVFNHIVKLPSMYSWNEIHNSKTTKKLACSVLCFHMDHLLSHWFYAIVTVIFLHSQYSVGLRQLLLDQLLNWFYYLWKRKCKQQYWLYHLLTSKTSDRQENVPKNPETKLCGFCFLWFKMYQHNIADCKKHGTCYFKVKCMRVCKQG